jgi:hypothetical protein
LAGFQVATITLAMANGFLLHIRLNPHDYGAEYWLLAVFLIQFCFLFNPLPFGHRRARMWLLRTMLRILGAPFVGPVQVLCLSMDSCFLLMFAVSGLLVG